MDRQNAEEAFVFYRSFFEAMEGLADRDKLVLYDAIARMGLYGEQPQLPLEAKRLFVLILPQLKANRKKRVEGRKGGRPASIGYTRENTTGSENEKPNEKEKENENEKEKENLFSPETTAAAGTEKKETIPSLGEIKRYVEDTHLPVDAEHFYNYYKANGWRMGQNPMQDWKAAVKAWARNVPVASRTAPAKEPSVGDNFKKAMELLRMKEAKQV